MTKMEVENYQSESVDAWLGSNRYVLLSCLHMNFNCSLGTDTWYVQPYVLEQFDSRFLRLCTCANEWAHLTAVILAEIITDIIFSNIRVHQQSTKLWYWCSRMLNDRGSQRPFADSAIQVAENGDLCILFKNEIIFISIPYRTYGEYRLTESYKDPNVNIFQYDFIIYLKFMKKNRNFRGRRLFSSTKSASLAISVIRVHTHTHTRGISVHPNETVHVFGGFFISSFCHVCVPIFDDSLSMQWWA